MTPSMGRLGRLAVLFSAGVLALSLSACSQDEGGTVDDIHLVKADALTVCTHIPYKPFQFTGDNGEVVGFDVDLVDLLAQDLGVETNVVSVDWNQITSGAVLAAGKCDLAMGGATITPKREEAVLFSDPYFNATQALLVKKGSDYAGLEDLEGKRLGTQTDTTGAIYAEKHAEEHGYTTVVFDDLALETTAVSAGKVDAAINDNGPLYQYAADNPETEIAAEFDTGERYGFLAKKDDENAQKLIDRLNQALATAKDDGTYDEIFKKWFGQVPGTINEE
ncbi:Glutamine ABC transporter periplasmic glutamine-binding protein [Salinisphaera shabanensis E1L3A]|uniref:Glutamine ABC transporter periplasmic glutamine-binding protein n=2 Tax=Salinisphaera shabanensis TaxID=180542 RepID=U2ERL9_9GAMM|nr:ABC transporter substrate-binding protein [Salinisphaera shabanensis]ERJ20647.1 Glutamine ABC transporter periplasmic glutamine-binding protein [Salinisphaera shabanensis E1L3A]